MRDGMNGDGKGQYPFVVRPGRCRSRTRHTLASMLKEISDLLCILRPGLYSLTIRIDDDCRFGFPGEGDDAA